MKHLLVGGGGALTMRALVMRALVYYENELVTNR